MLSLLQVPGKPLVCVGHTDEPHRHGDRPRALPRLVQQPGEGSQSWSLGPRGARGSISPASSTWLLSGPMAVLGFPGAACGLPLGETGGASGWAEVSRRGGMIGRGGPHGKETKPPLHSAFSSWPLPRPPRSWRPPATWSSPSSTTGSVGTSTSRSSTSERGRGRAGRLGRWVAPGEGGGHQPHLGMGGIWGLPPSPPWPGLQSMALQPAH